MKRTVALLTLIIISRYGGNLCAETYRVGPSRAFQTLQAVVQLLDPGDVVEVDGDHTYSGGIAFVRAGTAEQKIVIRGIEVNGNRPVLSGGTNTVAFTTPWPYSGPGADHYILEGFEVTGVDGVVLKVESTP